MTLAQMISDIYRDHGNEFQVEPADILRHLSTVQQMAFAHDCAAFMETSTLAWTAELGDGPYPWPSAARYVIAIEDSAGNDLRASMQPVRRSVTLAVDPGENCIFRYYIRPETLALETDDAKVLIPSEWHYPLLVQGAIMLCESASFADKATVPDLANVLAPFWASMDALPSYCGPRDSDAFLSSVGAW